MKKWIPFVLLLLVGCASTGGYQSAEKHLKRREYADALRAYLKVLNPRVRDGKRYINYEKEAVTGIGIVYWHMQQFEKAGKIFRAVLEKDPLFGQATYYMGMTYEGMGDDFKAIDLYQSFADLSPDDSYRNIIVGRLDWLKRSTYSRQVQQAVQQAPMLRVETLNPKSVAVLYFMSLSEEPRWRPLQKGLAELIARDLRGVAGVEVVDRLKINALMQEQGLSVSDLNDENSISRLAKSLECFHIVNGSFMVTPDMRLTLDASIYKADAAVFPDRADFDGSLTRLFKMEKELVLRIIDNLGIELDMQQRQKLLEIPTENIAAFLSYSEGLDALDREDFEGAQNHFRLAIEEDPAFRLSDSWLMLPEVWEATHNRNLVRVNHEVTQLVRTTSRGRVRMVYQPAPELLSKWNRLQWMAVEQHAGFIPGNDTRESFQESFEMAPGIVPEMLAEPPAPSIAGN